MSDATPAVAQLRDALARHGVRRLGVAVSGGGDSVAALLLACEVMEPRRVAAVTVDHGLRPDSAREAAGVAALCARLGASHDTLVWERRGGGNLQEAARRARLALIGRWAASRVDAVVLAHTLDDQAETVLMRLARGSGVDGLSGMARARRAQGVLWLRPFLTVPREDLRDILRARAIGWIEDPSNADPRFLRARARSALAALGDIGVSARGLAETADRMRRARAVLEGATEEAMRAHVIEQSGTALVDPGAMDLPGEIRDRLFARLIMALSGGEYRPRLEALHRLLAVGQGTLGGVVMRSDPGGLRLFREARAVAALAVPVGAIWDGRWRAEGGAGDAEIRATGSAGLAQLSRQARRGLHPHWRETGLPQLALQAMPALWKGTRMIAAPLAFWPQGWRLIARPLAAHGTEESQSH